MLFTSTGLWSKSSSYISILYIIVEQYQPKWKILTGTTLLGLAHFCSCYRETKKNPSWCWDTGKKNCSKWTKKPTLSPTSLFLYGIDLAFKIVSIHSSRKIWNFWDKFRQYFGNNSSKNQVIVTFLQKIACRIKGSCEVANRNQCYQRCPPGRLNCFVGRDVMWPSPLAFWFKCDPGHAILFSFLVLLKNFWEPDSCPIT